MEKLKKNGIKIPETYGVVGATLYQEFVVNDQSRQVLERLRQTTKPSPDELRALDQLVDIAARLDNAGAPTLGFIGDLIFDTDREQFLYIDAGYDLGEVNGVPITNALGTLTQKLKNHRGYIEEKYFEIKSSLLKA